MPSYLIKEEVVINGNRWLAGDVVVMSEEAMAEAVAEAAKESPPQTIVTEVLPEAPVATKTYKPTMKPIDLPSGMKPADIPYSEPPKTKPAPAAKTATR